MNGLALFAGGAIGELALNHILPDYRTVGYVDNEKYCQAIIRARIRDGVLDDAPIFDDIREFNARYASLYAGKVDWISAGFPCQPFSHAGKRQGEADERNMWPATVECISILRPQYAFLENVPGLVTHEYFRRIQGDLAEIFYDCIGLPLSAAEVGAKHKREREWMLAYPTRERRRGGNNGDAQGCGGSLQTQGSCPANQPEILADTECKQNNEQRRDSECRRDGVGRREQAPLRNNRQTDSDGLDGCGQDVADTPIEGGQSVGRRKEIKKQASNKSSPSSQDVADADKSRLAQRQKSEGRPGIIRHKGKATSKGGWWSVEPNVGRVVNELAIGLVELRTFRYGVVK